MSAKARLREWTRAKSQLKYPRLHKQSPKDAERDDPYCPLFDLLTNGTALELALAGRNTRRSIHRISAQLRGAATLRD